MYVINEFSKNPIFQINNHIGDDRDVLDDYGNLVQRGDGMGIDGKQFSIEVLSLNDADIDKLTFYTNSQGGDVQHSLDMFNAISMSKHKTHAIITGFAFSCAGWIPLAADKVDMVEETGKWMCHMPYNPENPEEQSQFMDEVVDIISKTIASKSGRNGNKKKTPEDIKKLMREKTYWSAKRMYDEGLIDNVVNAKGKVIRLEKDPITLNKSELNFFYKEYQIAQNKYVSEYSNLQSNTKTQINMSYIKIVNRLNKIDSKALGFRINLSEDATEDVLLDTIIRIENHMKALNDDMMDKETSLSNEKKLGEDIKNKLSEKEIELEAAKKKASDSMASCNELQESLNKMKAEALDAENKVKEAALNLRKEKATNLINKAIEDGKVKATTSMTIDQVKEYMINKATDDYAGIELQLSQAKGVFKAPKPGLKNQLPSGLVIGVDLIEKMKAENIQRIRETQVRVLEGGQKIRMYDNKLIANA